MWLRHDNTFTWGKILPYFTSIRFETTEPGFFKEVTPTRI